MISNLVLINLNAVKSHKNIGKVNFKEWIKINTIHAIYLPGYLVVKL